MIEATKEMKKREIFNPYTLKIEVTTEKTDTILKNIISMDDTIPREIGNCDIYKKENVKELLHYLHDIINEQEVRRDY